MPGAPPHIVLVRGMCSHMSERQASRCSRRVVAMARDNAHFFARERQPSRCPLRCRDAGAWEAFTYVSAINNPVGLSWRILLCAGCHDAGARQTAGQVEQQGLEALHASIEDMSDKSS